MPDRRIALVIGNATYTHATRLNAPKEDAAAMVGVLERLGFTVLDGYDCDFSRLRKLRDDFLNRLDAETTALFYFSGHGAQSLDNSNYLLAVEAKIDEPEDLGRFGMLQGRLLRDMRQRARISLLFLDACRDDPFADAPRPAGTKSIVAERPGLARVARGDLGQALIAYAAAEGRTAIDPGTGLSPFTAELVGRLESKGQGIRDVLSEVRKAVKLRTGGAQDPWTNDALEEEVFLLPDAEVVKPDPPPAQPDRPEVLTPVPPVEPPRPPRRVWPVIPAFLLGMTFLVVTPFVLKPTLICVIPGMEDLSVCQPDFKTAAGLATLIPALDSPDDNRRRAAQARLASIFQVPYSIDPLEMKLLVQELLNAAEIDRVKAMSAKGRLSLLFVLAEIPSELWNLVGWSGVRAAAQAVQVRLQEAYRSGDLDISESRPAYLAEFGSRIGATDARPDELTVGSLARLIPDLKSSDPSVSGTALKMLLGTFQADLLPPQEKLVLAGELLTAAGYWLREETSQTGWANLLKVLGSIPRETWANPSWTRLLEQAISVASDLDRTAVSGDLPLSPDAFNSLTELITNIRSLRTDGYAPSTIDVRTFFAVFTRSEVDEIVTTLAQDGIWQMAGEPFRTDEAIGKAQIRYFDDEMVVNAGILARKLEQIRHERFKVVRSPEVAAGTLEIWISK